MAQLKLGMTAQIYRTPDLSLLMHAQPHAMPTSIHSDSKRRTGIFSGSGPLAKLHT